MDLFYRGCTWSWNVTWMSRSMTQLHDLSDMTWWLTCMLWNWITDRYLSCLDLHTWYLTMLSISVKSIHMISILRYITLSCDQWWTMSECIAHFSSFIDIHQMHCPIVQHQLLRKCECLIYKMHICMYIQTNGQPDRLMSELALPKL